MPAEVLPEHKAGEIRWLQAEHRQAGMVSDGINDAPRADSGQRGVGHRHRHVALRGGAWLVGPRVSALHQNLVVGVKESVATTAAA